MLTMATAVARGKCYKDPPRYSAGSIPDIGAGANISEWTDCFRAGAHRNLLPSAELGFRTDLATTGILNDLLRFCLDVLYTALVAGLALDGEGSVGWWLCPDPLDLGPESLGGAASVRKALPPGGRGTDIGKAPY